MKLKLLFLLLLSMTTLAGELNCSSDGYSFSVKDKYATITTPELSVMKPVTKTGSNYSGVLNVEGYYGYRFVLSGKKGELKLIGRKSLNISMTCSRL